MTGPGTERGPGPPGVDALTDPEALRAGDHCALLPALATAGAQVRALAEQVAPASFERPRSLIVVEPVPAGDGALAAALLHRPRTPVVTVTGLPDWAGPLDLAVVLAATPDDGPTAELIAEADRRGVALVVRGAAHGPVAAAAGRALLAPRVAAPEIAAGPARVALVLAMALAAGIAPAAPGGADSAGHLLDAMADALDAEALACGPAVEPFVNPAVALALHLSAGPPLLIADGPAGMALAERAARSLRLLGGAPAAAEHAAAVLAGGQLPAALGRPVDPFADPDIDAPAVPTAVTVLVDPPDGSTSPALAALARALPRAAVLPADASEGPPAARALAAALRVDIAAGYLGIAAGQVPPPDGPYGLGPAAAARGALPGVTVEDVTRDNWDDQDGRSWS